MTEEQLNKANSLRNEIRNAEEMIEWLQNKQKELMRKVISESEVLHYITSQTELDVMFKLAIQKQEIKIFELKQEFEEL